jgi:CRP/FNR family cyclic AMP-dependent transcriptional regulator
MTTATKKILYRLPLFEGLSAPTLRTLAMASREITVDEGDWLFHEGEEADALYVILRGAIDLKMTIDAERIDCADLERLGAGETIGWSALVEPYVFTLSAVAVENTHLLKLEATDVRAWAKQEPEEGYKLMSRLAQLIRRRLSAMHTHLVSVIVDFPIVDLMDNELSATWLEKHLHPEGIKCPHCGTEREQAHESRRPGNNNLMEYCCGKCGWLYNLYSGTAFEGKKLRPAQVVLLLRGLRKGESDATLAHEIGIPRTTVRALRLQLQVRAEQTPPDSILPGNERIRPDMPLRAPGWHDSIDLSSTVN